MTEDQVKRIADDFISKSHLDPCEFASIRRFPKSSLDGPITVEDEWVVTYEFKLPDDVACSTEIAIVVVDDATGNASFLESL